MIGQWLFRRRTTELGWLLAFTLTGLTVWFGIQLHQKAARPIGYDLTHFLAASRLVAQGLDPYVLNEPWPFIYPLGFPCLLVPLTLVPERGIHSLWYLMTLAALAGILYLLAHWQQQRWSEPHFLIPSALALLVFVGPLQNHFLNGQTNLCIVFFTCLFWHHFCNGRSGQAGAWLAFGISIKIVPALLLSLVVLQRRWQTLVAVLAVGGLGSLVLPMFFLQDQTLACWWHFGQKVLGEFQQADLSKHHPWIFTLHGFWAWYWPAVKTIAGTKLFCAALLAAVTLTVDWQYQRRLAQTYPTALDLTTRPRQSVVDPWRLQFYLLTILLIGPMSEIHHLVWLLPTLVLLTQRWYHQSRHGSTNSAQRLELALLICLGALYLAKLIPGPMHFAALVGLYATTVWQAWEQLPPVTPQRMDAATPIRLPHRPAA